MSSYWIFLKIVAVGYFGISAIASTSQTNTQNLRQSEEPIRNVFYYRGNEREYFVWLPQDFDVDHTYWALVAAHGGGSNGRNFWLTRDLRTASDKNGLKAIVISPSFLKEDPNSQRFPVLGEGAFLERMIEDVSAKYRLHPKILLTGYSRGAQFTHRFALWNPDYVQACAPLSAGSWTTPQGRFLMYSLGEVKDPKSYLAVPKNGENLPAALKSLFDPRVATVAGQPASSGAKRIPFLVMCGTMDERFEMAQEFAHSLKRLGYTVKTVWPKTMHGGRKKDEYRVEFEKYSQVTVEFFLRVTESK
jgi:poly(3-hydroxybutyrate) depolymerase